MWFSQWALPAVLLLADASIAAAKSITYSQSLRRRSTHLQYMDRASEMFQGDLERRSPQQSSSSDSLSLSAPDVEKNATTLDACATALTGMQNVTNTAGFAACYNILDWHETMGMFQADLRLFQISQPWADFAAVPANEILVMLTYPESTQFQSLMKRSTHEIVQRQDSMNQVQQYSLWGNFKMQLDMSKLNSTDLMSLMIPAITLQATSSNQTTFTTNITASDTVYFVAGQFTDQATPQNVAQAVDPAVAAAAIASSQGFVLPGTSLGIFPTGLIVTVSWTLMFFLAFGVGTFGRIRHRNIYRRRKSATSARAGRR